MHRIFFRALAAAGLLVFASTASASDVTVTYGNGAPIVFGDAQVYVSGDRSRVAISASNGPHWIDADFAAPSGQTLARGVYRDAERTPFRTGRAPGVDAGFDGQGCNEVWGEFTIRQIAHDDEGALTMLDATLVRRCSPTDTPLTVAVRYKAKAYQFQYISTPGDYIGLGARKTMRGHTTDLALWGTTSHLTFAASGERQDWHVTIAPPSGQTLAVGTYTTSRFGSVVDAGLDATGEGRGCNQSTGTLTINAIRTDKTGNVVGLNASFAQSCDGGPPFYGVIRYYL